MTSRHAQGRNHHRSFLMLCCGTIRSDTNTADNLAGMSPISTDAIWASECLLRVHVPGPASTRTGRQSGLRGSSLSRDVSAVEALTTAVRAPRPCRFPRRYFLPPIIFYAGLSVKKKKFFRNLGSIATLGILGTYILFAVIAFCLYAISMLPNLLSFGVRHRNHLAKT